MPLCCKYYSVGYFVFVKQPGAKGFEPLAEVDDPSAGEEMIKWLSRVPFVIRQLLRVANDNVMK
jgi:hypothetical protein